jgi:5-methylcytosine-specific restriction endonuclease McrA
VTRSKREREEYYQRLRDERQSQSERQREQWRADYEAYLQSQEWADKRELIFKRAKGFCEGCGQAPAREVHHLSYENCFNEFLWELVAICRDCHERVHGANNE